MISPISRLVLWLIYQAVLVALPDGDFLRKT